MAGVDDGWEEKRGELGADDEDREDETGEELGVDEEVVVENTASSPCSRLSSCVSVCKKASVVALRTMPIVTMNARLEPIPELIERKCIRDWI